MVNSTVKSLDNKIRKENTRSAAADDGCRSKTFLVALAHFGNIMLTGVPLYIVSWIIHLQPYW